MKLIVTFDIFQGTHSVAADSEVDPVPLGFGPTCEVNCIKNTGKAGRNNSCGGSVFGWF